MLAALQKAGYHVRRARPRRITTRRRRNRAPKRARCADLFKKHRETIDGIIVTLPNFGDERAIADTLRMAGLQRPSAGPGHAGYARQHDHRRSPR